MASTPKGSETQKRSPFTFSFGIPVTLTDKWYSYQAISGTPNRPPNHTTKLSHSVPARIGKLTRAWPARLDPGPVAVGHRVAARLYSGQVEPCHYAQRPGNPIKLDYRADAYLDLLGADLDQRLDLDQASDLDLDLDRCPPC